MGEYEELLGGANLGKKVKLNLPYAVNQIIELMDTEKTYVENLKVATQLVERLKVLQRTGKQGTPGFKWNLTPEDLKVLFLNLPDLYEMHNSLYSDLKQLRYYPEHDLHCLLSDPETHQKQRTHVGDLLLGLGALFKSYIPYFRLYVTYVNNYAQAVKALKQAREKYPDFDFFLGFNQEVLKIADMEALMITPVQRIPRYVMLMGEILGAGAGLGEEAESGASLEKRDERVERHEKKQAVTSLTAAFGEMKEVAQKVNESFRLIEARELVINYDKRVRYGRMHTCCNNNLCMYSSAFSATYTCGGCTFRGSILSLSFHDCNQTPSPTPRLYFTYLTHLILPWYCRSIEKVCPSTVDMGTNKKEKKSLVTPSRYHVKTAVLLKKKSGGGMRLKAYSRWLFVLFNDCLLWTTVPSEPLNYKGRCTAIGQ